MKRSLEDAHIASWIKATIMGIRSGSERGSYRQLGYSIGVRLEDFLDDIDPMDRFSADEWSGMLAWDGREQYHLRIGVKPTAILKRIFASERHPDGYGDLVRQIPFHQRGNFLTGIINGYMRDR